MVLTGSRNVRETYSSQETEAELPLELVNLPVDRMQWGAEEWQFADLYMQMNHLLTKDEGVPCVMLIHGGFWRKSSPRFDGPYC